MIGSRIGSRCARPPLVAVLLPLLLAGLALAQNDHGPYDPQDLGVTRGEIRIRIGAVTSAERGRLEGLYGPYEVGDLIAFLPTEHATATAEIWATASPYDDRVVLRAVISTGPLAGVTVRGWTGNDDNWNRGFVHHYGRVDVAYAIEPISGELLVEVVFTDGPMAGSSARSWDRLF